MDATDEMVGPSRAASSPRCDVVPEGPARDSTPPRAVLDIAVRRENEAQAGSVAPAPGRSRNRAVLRCFIWTAEGAAVLGGAAGRHRGRVSVRSAYREPYGPRLPFERGQRRGEGPGRFGRPSSRATSGAPGEAIRSLGHALQPRVIALNNYFNVEPFARLAGGTRAAHRPCHSSAAGGSVRRADARGGREMEAALMVQATR